MKKKPSTLAAILGCKASNFLITYLGLPLSNKRLTREAYQKLIQQEEHCLAGWKAGLLSIGGRLVLLNAVLTAQPIYYMLAFLLPKWVITKLDKIHRRFL
jgi:hypothetical protein